SREIYRALSSGNESRAPLTRRGQVLPRRTIRQCRSARFDPRDEAASAPRALTARDANRKKKSTASHPVADCGVRNLEVDGGLRNAVRGFFVEFQVLGGHVDAVLSRRSPSILQF